jgi:hypothetical protein
MGETAVQLNTDESIILISACKCPPPPGIFIKRDLEVPTRNGGELIFTLHFQNQTQNTKR